MTRYVQLSGDIITAVIDTEFPCPDDCVPLVGYDDHSPVELCGSKLEDGVITIIHGVNELPPPGPAPG